MPQTTVGLFKNPMPVGEAVREFEKIGFLRSDLRILTEPAAFDVTGVMSFGRLGFEVNLVRELERIGTTKQEANAYVGGLRRGGVLLFATGSAEKAAEAANIMDRLGAVEIEETNGAELHLPTVTRANVTPIHDSSVLAGRFVHSGDGACVFVW